VFFWLEIREKSEFDEVLVNNLLLDSFVYCRRSEFSKTTYGKLLNFAVTATRDFGFLVVEIALTSISMWYFKKFFVRKQRITLNNIEEGPIENKNSKLTSNADSKESKLAKISKPRTKVFIDYKKSNKKLNLMSIYFAFFSIMSNIASLLATILNIIMPGDILYDWFAFFNKIINIIKYLATFFLLYLFNKKFRYFFIRSKN
jgi:hypothetical protein